MEFGRASPSPVNRLASAADGTAGNARSCDVDQWIDKCGRSSQDQFVKHVQGGDLLAWIQQDIQIATVTVDTFSLSQLGPTIAAKAGAR